MKDSSQKTEVVTLSFGKVSHWRKKRIHWVGFAIKTELVRKLDHLPVGVNERLMTLQLNLCNNRRATLISAYAPTLLADQHEKELFYGDLDLLLSQIPRSHKTMVLGDFNARVGCNHLVWKDVIGRNRVGKCNSNGEVLLTKCAKHNLTITNTLFRQKDRRKISWRHARSGHWHLIDFIIVRQVDQYDVHMTRSVEASDACWTDHRMILSHVNFKLQPKQRKLQKRKPTKYNVNRLSQPEIREKFQTDLASSLEDLPLDTIDRTWDNLKSRIKQHSEMHLGKQARHNEDWFDENDDTINELMKQKRESFQAWQKNFRNKQLQTDYHIARSEIQKRVRKLKNDWWIKKSEELQTLAVSHCSKEFFAATRKSYGPSSGGARPISGKDGTVYKEREKILRRWGEHFSELLNQESIVNDNITNTLPQARIRYDLADPPTMTELHKAISMTKSGKAAGPDGIPAEVFKAGGVTLTKTLLELFQRIWNIEKIPADLKDANIVTIFKKGNKSECGNYRGISLLSIAGKILARIVSFRLGQLTESVLPESQCGFRPNRGTVDMIIAARQIQEKCREQHQDLYMAFIDLTKAFDTVHRPTLWKVLLKIGCPEKLVRVVRLLHEGMRASVMVDGEYTEEFEVNTGVK